MVSLRKIFSLSTLTLIVALSLSAIAAWYSILGLTAIFAAAVIPIIIMGGALEVAKVTTTVWLHRYWNKASWTFRLYLVPAVVALALLTSMGIFGFLSKAHIDQGIPTGDQSAQVSLLEEKIVNERQNIDAARSLLKQMDDAVIGITASKDKDIKQRDGSVFSQSGAERAVAVRRSQAKERAELTRQIEEAQARIVKIQEEKAPIASQLRKVEAEVGPIRYVAALIYGDNPDANTLERAVRWMIILIVFVFDPLALILVLAATSSYKWDEEDYKNKEDEEGDSPLGTEPTSTPTVTEPLPKTVVEEDDDELTCNKCNTTLVNAPGIGHFCPNKECDVLDGPFEESTIEGIKDEYVQPNDVKLDDVVREDVHETLAPDTVPSVDRLEHPEVEVTGPVEPEVREPVIQPEIKTEGVTIQETDGGYIQFEGKSISRGALQEMHPEIFRLTADSSNQVSTNFGTQFPRIAKRGDVFVRVDLLPNRVYKFGGDNWIEINKNQSDSYLYDESYIQYLITKLDSGEYDIDLLSDNERAQIEEHLRSQNT
jgi:hypothetical protein